MRRLVTALAILTLVVACAMPVGTAVAQDKKANPCSPEAAKKAANPCNPEAAKKAANPCNPEAAKKAANPCNPGTEKAGEKKQ